MLSRISVRQIVSDHLKTLNRYDPTVEQSEERPSVADILLFFAFPGFLSLLFAWLHPSISKDLANNLIAIFSIFAGLLFNLLVLLYDLATREENQSRSRKLKLRTIKEIYSNVSFQILVSLLTTIVLVLSIALQPADSISSNVAQANQVAEISLITKLIAGAIYYLCIFFLLNLLMILKRIYILIGNEIKSAES